MLSVKGQVDPETGLGSGQVMMAPRHMMHGCTGHFEVALDSDTPEPEQAGEAFKVNYRIDLTPQADKDRWFF